LPIIAVIYGNCCKRQQTTKMTTGGMPSSERCAVFSQWDHKKNNMLTKHSLERGHFCAAAKIS
jgi:hypothetical protein